MQAERNPNIDEANLPEIHRNHLQKGWLKAMLDHKVPYNEKQMFEALKNPAIQSVKVTPLKMDNKMKFEIIQTTGDQDKSPEKEALLNAENIKLALNNYFPNEEFSVKVIKEDEDDKRGNNANIQTDL